MFAYLLEMNSFAENTISICIDRCGRDRWLLSTLSMVESR